MNQLQYKLLRVKVNALSITQLNSLIAESIKRKYKSIIANHNLHSIYIYHHEPLMQAFYNKADYIHIDGMPLIFIGKLMGYPMRLEHRVTYVDWIWSLTKKAAENKWRIFYLGSKPGISKIGAEILQNRFPQLQIFTHHGYFNVGKNSSENLTVLAAINEYKPHILMVGMGMPRQEYWILENLDKIHTNVILPCGACIDYIAEAIPTPPRKISKFGLEWFFRLLSEPRRLWRRYLLESWFIFGLFLKDIWKLEKITSNISK